MVQDPDVKQMDDYFSGYALSIMFCRNENCRSSILTICGSLSYSLFSLHLVSLLKEKMTVVSISLY